MRRLFLGLAAVVALLVIADFAVAITAEYRVSRAVRADAGLGADPEVTIAAFPFLTTVPRGSASSITVSAQDVPTPVPYRTTVEAELTGVTFPEGGPLAHPSAPVAAEHVTARWVIGQTSLGRLLGVPDLEVSEAPDPDESDGDAPAYGPPLSPHRVKLTGTVQTSTGDADPVRRTVSVVAYLVLDHGTVSIVPTTVWPQPSGPGTTPRPVPPLQVVGPQFSATIDAGALPFSIPASSVRAEATDLVIEGRTTDLTAPLAGFATADGATTAKENR